MVEAQRSAPTQAHERNDHDHDRNQPPTVENGTTVFIPLKLKKHPNNARKTPHSEASIEAKAASIAAKGILQNLVEPETDAAGEPTGFYLVSIGDPNDSVLKERMAGPKALREQATADAARVQMTLDGSGDQSITVDMIDAFASEARNGLRLEGGGYRRDRLRAPKEIRTLHMCPTRVASIRPVYGDRAP